jgi:phage tail P2-like protein
MSDLLPANSTRFERALATAITEPIAAIPDPFRTIWDADTCPLALLPWLAWAFSVDRWDTNWSEAQKRGAVRASMSIHRRKGTVGALKESLGALGHELDVREWHQLEPVKGDPYTFSVRVTVDQEGVPDPAAFDNIVSVAEATKNVRSRLVSVDVLGRTTAAICFAGASACGETVSLTSYSDHATVISENTICF